MKKSSYKTKQRASVLKCLEEHGSEHLNVTQIANYLKSEEMNVSVPTIYRVLDELIASGQVRKYSLDGNTAACFQLISCCENEAEHFHLKCDKCGHLQHFKSKELSEIQAAIRKDAEADVNLLQTVFHGTCKDCKN